MKLFESSILQKQSLRQFRTLQDICFQKIFYYTNF